MKIVPCDPEEKSENGDTGRRGQVGIPDILDQVGSSPFGGSMLTTVSPQLRLCVVPSVARAIAPVGGAADLPARGSPMSEGVHD